MADVERYAKELAECKLLKTVAQFIENCDKGEAELLSQYCNYLKSHIPDDVQYQDFYHWCLAREDRKKLSGIDCEGEER